MRPAEYRFHFAQQVGVGEHHPLGIRSGAGSVEQGSDHIRFNRGGHETARACRKDAVKIGHRRKRGRSGIRLSICRLVLGRIDKGNLDGKGGNRLLCGSGDV